MNKKEIIEEVVSSIILYPLQNAGMLIQLKKSSNKGNKEAKYILDRIFEVSNEFPYVQ